MLWLTCSTLSQKKKSTEAFLATLENPEGAEKITKAVYWHTQLAFHASVASKLLLVQLLVKFQLFNGLMQVLGWGLWLAGSWLLDASLQV